MYKLIACDLDETLLADDKKISAQNLAAIKAAIAGGVYFVPNTGRSYLTVQKNLQQLGLEQKKDQYVISYNGGAIVENFHNRILQTQAMPFAIVERLFKIGIQHGYCIHVYTLNHLYIWNLSAAEIGYITGRVNNWIECDSYDLGFLKNTKLIKIIYYVSAEEQRQRLRKQIQASFSYPMNITFSSDRYIEFNSIRADKGQAVTKLGKHLGIKPNEIIAIGDNGNDLPMIEQAGLGVCVANGKNFVKQVANYITTADNNHSAVAEVVKKFILNKDD